MKKILTLAAVMLLTASNTFAYKDTVKGFEIKNQMPQATIHTSDTYGYLENFDYSAKDLKNLQEEQLKLVNANFVTVLKKEAVNDILKSDFTTASFDEQYDKLQLLKRSDLSLATLPVPVAELANYVQNNKINSISINELRFGKNNFKLEEIKPILSADKIGKYKTITNTYFVKQAGIPYIINTSFISADDKLFILSSSSAGEKPKQSARDKFANYNKPKLEELVKVENAELSDFAEGNIQKAWHNHVRFIKNFKILNEKKSDKIEQFGYLDSFTNTRFALPDNWLYQEVNIKDQQFKGQIILALPQDVLYKLADNDAAYNMALDVLDDVSITEFENKVIDDQQVYKEVLTDTDVKEFTKIIADNLDSIFIAANITDRQEDFKDLLQNTEETKFLLDVMFAELFADIAKNNNDIFKLNSYDYLIDISPKRGNINLDFNMDLFEKNKYNTKIKFLCDNKNKVTALMYLDKEDDNAYEEVEKQIKQWDF